MKSEKDAIRVSSMKQHEVNELTEYAYNNLDDGGASIPSINLV